MDGPRLVGIVVDYEVDYIREAAAGAMAFVRCHPGLRFRLLVRTDFRGTRAAVRDMDGLLGGFADADDVRRIASLRLPAVNISANRPCTLPSVLTDDRAVGRLAADHLLERGFRHFAYVETQASFAHERGEGFRNVLAGRGISPVLLAAGDRRLRRRLQALPRPAALFAANDFLARRLVTLCLESGWRIPEDLAVLGVDNGEFDCETAGVPLSSVDPAAERVGYEAAALLARLIAGDTPPPQPVLIPPARVVTRASTDILALDDPVLLHACRYIRDHTCQPMRIGDLVAGIAVSRRTLEKRFRRRFGRTLHAEVDRVRFDHARELLVTTSLRITDIAGRCGFADYARFTRCFRRRVGTTPTGFRTRYRPR